MDAATNVQSLFSLSALKITAGFFKHYVWFLAFQSFWTTWIARSQSSAHRHFFAPTDFMPQSKSIERKQDAARFTIYTGQCIQHPSDHTSAEQDPYLLLQHTNPVYSFFIIPQGEVSEEPTKQNILSHMFRSTKSQHKENYGSPTAFCCLVTIILFKFTTFILWAYYLMGRNRCAIGYYLFPFWEDLLKLSPFLYV